jgi:PAS domain S-box-containing protein
VNFSELIAQAVLLTRSDAIIAADRDGIIRFWNPGAERIFGHVSGEAIGRSLDLIIPERLRQRHWDGFRHTMETGHSRYGEGDLLSVPALRKDGTTISVEFTIVLLKTESVVVCGIVAIMRDVTQRFEEMRHLRRKLAASGHAAAPPRSVMNSRRFMHGMAFLLPRSDHQQPRSSRGRFTALSAYHPANGRSLGQT